MPPSWYIALSPTRSSLSFGCPLFYWGLILTLAIRLNSISIPSPPPEVGDGAGSFNPWSFWPGQKLSKGPSRVTLLSIINLLRSIRAPVNNKRRSLLLVIPRSFEALCKELGTKLDTFFFKCLHEVY